MNNLKDIHNQNDTGTTKSALFYQDVNEQFEVYTQLGLIKRHTFEGCFIRMSMNNLKDIHNQGCADYKRDNVVLSGCQ